MAWGCRLVSTAMRDACLGLRAVLLQEFLGTEEGFEAFLEFERKEFNSESLYFWEVMIFYKASIGK